MDGGSGGGAVLSLLTTVPETGSTNADLLAAAASGAPEGRWLRAERQHAGRGRQGRHWLSAAGNCYASTLVRLRPADPPAASLALVAAVALDEVARAFLPHAGAALAIKWPNDLLLGGAKVAGILLEREREAVVIGFGVNLASAPELADRPTTSLSAHGAGAEPQPFYEALAEAFARWLGTWRGRGLDPVRMRWQERAHSPGTALVTTAGDGTPVSGLFDGLDRDGALILREATGARRVIRAGDVFLA